MIVSPACWLLLTLLRLAPRTRDAAPAVSRPRRAYNLPVSHEVLALAAVRRRRPPLAIFYKLTVSLKSRNGKPRSDVL